MPMVRYLRSGKPEILGSFSQVLVKHFAMWKHYRRIRQVKTHAKKERPHSSRLARTSRQRKSVSLFTGPTYKDHFISYIIISFFFFLVIKIGERVTYLL
jgi:hypothetical protein